ncbi:hypothetical protein EV368DRAFT_67499 [Lentinula lateritia]|nr:hypothetical protein EV368DRAFT_67499 [Lentinula lateritia]
MLVPNITSKSPPGTGFPVPAVTEVKIKVLEVFQPRVTISPVLKVALTTKSRSPHLPSTLVLKVYKVYARRSYQKNEMSDWYLCRTLGWSLEIEVLNKDMRLENFIVPSNPGFGSPDRCRDTVIIDFAQARSRWEDEDDGQWKRVKWSTDEKGAIRYVLQKQCGWAYQPTYPY